VNISHLIYDSYRKFGHLISPREIGRLRVKHRMKVVQSLEDVSMRNALRGLELTTPFGKKELEELFLLVRGDHLWQVACGKSNGNGGNTPSNEADSQMSSHQSQLIDFDQFKTTMMSFSPWAANGNPNLVPLLQRLFRVQL